MYVVLILIIKIWMLLLSSVFLFVCFAVVSCQAMYLLFSFGMASLYIGEVVFFAFIGIKKGVFQAIWALILIFITIAWHFMASHDIVLCHSKRDR